MIKMPNAILPKKKTPKPKRVYKKVSDKTINLYTSAVLPQLQSINPLFSLVASRGFALSKRSNDKLGTPLKKSNNMLIIIAFIVIAIVAFVAVFLMLGGGGNGQGGILDGTPLGPLSKIGESFNLPNLSNK